MGQYSLLCAHINYSFNCCFIMLKLLLSCLILAVIVSQADSLFLGGLGYGLGLGGLGYGGLGYGLGGLGYGLGLGYGRLGYGIWLWKGIWRWLWRWLWKELWRWLWKGLWRWLWKTLQEILRFLWWIWTSNFQLWTWWIWISISQLWIWPQQLWAT